ncbi:SDR family oxidoreductase [Polyangium jinanense]|uniref:SDR family oxidoreductase n=1 Tax=Polyangium jinanense TaxID=2829994 RepID=A0A9X3XES7_9BACT|nr:SDR family oxidoreductase [Polyangium jinanense]MDC3962397.1 SDR family oxidoreductase [Polyangium jinanense]MDC3989289.1 SDR family oxidoreductase [Polyangium jinanense]
MSKVALVTGASRGIGRDIGRWFAERGFDLILVARDAAKLAENAEALRRELGVAASVVAVDLCDFDAARAALQVELRRYGRLDVLVNSAGIFRFGTSSISVGDLEALLTTNVKAVHNVCIACLDALAAAGSAHVFNIASITGVEPFAAVGGYATSKHALVGYSRSLARELLPRGIKVTTLCPDAVDTDMAVGSGLRPEQMITTADIRRAIEFVLSLSPAALVDLLVIGRKPA